MAKNLTDAELKSELAKYGTTDIGPLTKTTRPVYEKRLEKLRNKASGGQQKIGHLNGESSEDDRSAVSRRRSTRLKVAPENNSAKNRNVFDDDEDEQDSESRPSAIGRNSVTSSSSSRDPVFYRSSGNVESTTTVAPPVIVPGLANFPKTSGKYRSIASAAADTKKSINQKPDDYRSIGGSYSSSENADWGLTISDSDEEKNLHRKNPQQPTVIGSFLFGGRNVENPNKKPSLFNSGGENGSAAMTSSSASTAYRRPTSLRDEAAGYGNSLWNSSGRINSYGSTSTTTADRGGVDNFGGAISQAAYLRKPVYTSGASRIAATTAYDPDDLDLDEHDYYTKRFDGVARQQQQHQYSKPAAPQWSFVSGLTKNLHKICGNVNQRLASTLYYWKNKIFGGGQQQRQNIRSLGIAGRSSLDDDAYWSSKYRFSAKVPPPGGDYKSKLGYGRSSGDEYQRYGTEKRWWHLNDQTSRFILIAFLVFLFILTFSYLGLVHRDKASKCVTIVYYACLDTLAFVYMNMILPLIVVVAVVSVGYGVYRYKKYKWHKEAEEQRMIYEMVEKIIATLKKHHEECLADGNRPPYLAVPHVRDMLIPFNRRKEMLPIWDKAVEYLNESESRVRTETQCISGEEFMVWRWLQQTANPNKSNDKMWMGHAFPEEDIPFNMPRYAYYECLKARGLFDPDQETENGWPEHIQDAILEKLGVNIHVVHMAVDMESKDGCVYLKLTSKNDAGEAYKILHGSWFNGRLVSVKYLRPERYHERFPDSVKANIPLCVKKPRHSTLNLPK